MGCEQQKTRSSQIRSGVGRRGKRPPISFEFWPNLQVIDQLISILKTGGAGGDNSPTTLAVACHDIGEFARLHPMGRKICVSKGAKERVLDLMSSQDRELAREALLCVQKLMLTKGVMNANVNKVLV